MINKYFNEDYRIVADTSEPDTNVISGSGGGGCFPAGTMVRTQTGYKPIEKFIAGELILAYDRFGEIDFAKITEVHVHTKDTYQDDLYYVYAGKVSLFPKGITGNHAVFDPSTGEHKEIKDFAVGDKVADLTGALLTITKIKVTPNADLPDTCTVYNFTVEPQHTYFVGDGIAWVRVHNGGGGKSSSAGAARAAQEAPNTLRTAAIARILEVISHGEIVGVIGGAKGALFNNTVLQNTDNTYNFPGVTFDQRTGLPSQTPIAGFSEVESELALAGTTITSAGVIEQLPGSGINAARVTIRLNDGLWSQNTSNGDLNGYTVSFAIYTKDRLSSTWGLIFNETINDKATTPAELAYRVSAPLGSTQWDIKVVRTSPEDATSATKSVISLTRITTIIEQNLSYDKIAYVGVSAPASSVGNQIPARGYNVLGIKVQVPYNYNPTLRTYGPGYWNGAFKTAWTDNTAWILYDLITNAEYGINNYLNQPIEVDIWSFYEASLYNDCVTWNGSTYSTNLIPDGNGGYEVRFRFNAVIATQSDAWQLLHAVASNMRALLVMKGNQISLLQDRPAVAKRIINNSNVIDGMFVYSSVENTSRATAINVTFNNKLDRYLPKVISEQDNTAIAKYGYNVKDIVAYGVTSESQARRQAKWALWTEINQGDMVSFSMALNIIDMEVGSIVPIMDDDYISDTNDYLSGRVLSVVGNVVTLGNPVTLQAGHTYTFGVMSLYYDYIEEAIITSAAGTVTSLTLSTALPVGNYENHEFFCYSSGYITPRYFRIQSINETAKGMYALTGQFYDVQKFAAIEQGVTVIPGNYSNLISTVLPPVSNITMGEVFMNDGITSHNYIYVRWQWDETHTIKDPVTFTVKWRRDNNVFKTVRGITLKEFHIEDTTPGVYDVTILVENLQGKKSLAVDSTYNYRVVASNSTLVAPVNFYVLGTSGVVFTGRHIPLTWDFPAENSYKTDTLLDYILETWTVNGATKLSTFVVKPNVGDKGGSFDYTLEMNKNDYGSPSRSVQFKLYSRDMVGDVSLPNIITANNPVPALTNWEVNPSFGANYVKITPSTEDDVTEYIIYAGTSAGFTKNDAAIVYAGPDTYKNLEAEGGVTMYYAVSIADSFGRDGILISTEQSATAVSVDPDTFTYTGLKFKPNDPSTNRVTWEAATATRTTQAGVTTTWNITAETTGKLWTAGTMYIYYVPGDTTLSVNTSLVAAITAGGRIVATYKGGTDVTADEGRAFTSGDMILAGTVGSNALVTNTAVITNAAQIGNVIESDGYSWTPGAYSGWRIDKSGYAQFTSITIRDTGGNLLFSSGTGMEWSYVNGKPTTLAGINSTEGTKLSGIAAGADVTSANTAAAIAGQGSFATLNQLNSSNITTYMANAAIGSAQIGSIALIGTSNFSVKSGTGGARQEMDNQGTRIYDSSGVLRVKIGNLA